METKRKCHEQCGVEGGHTEEDLAAGFRCPEGEPLRSRDVSGLMAEICLKDAEHLERMAILTHGGGDLAAAKRELERAHDRYGRYLSELQEAARAEREKGS